MKSIIVVILLCSLSAVAQSGGVVNEAKGKLEAEHHKALVDKAKHLLAVKAQCEAKLASIDKKLEQLDQGKDVKDVADEVNENDLMTFTTNTCCSVPAAFTMDIRQR